MRLALTRCTVPLLALACLLVPPVAGQGVASGQVVAKSVHLEQAAQRGALQFLHVTQGEAPSPLRLALAGQHLQATQYDDEGLETSGGAFNTLRALNTAQPNRGHTVHADRAQAVSTNLPADCRLDVFMAAGAGEFRATLAGGRQLALARPQLGPGRIQEASGDTAGNPVPSLPTPDMGGGEIGYWTYHDADSAHVLTEAEGAATLHLEGTFTVEVIGLDFRLRGDGVDATLHSGTERAPLQPGAPDAVHTVRQSFLRITVTQGTLDLHVGRAALVQWSGPATGTVAQAAFLHDATGSLTLANGQEQRLAHATYRLDGPADLQANPSQQGLQLALTGLDAGGQPLAPAPASAVVRPAALPVGWVAAGAVAAGTGAALLTLALRHRPTMAGVEASLEAGRFRRAAWESARLLRRRPGYEDAVLGRAIALSKLGRHPRVVREVQAHLAAREPSDGVLHYVLGLALKKVGALAEAHAAWREALRRTPALLPQVKPLLAGQQPSSPSNAVASAVDGTAYA